MAPVLTVLVSLVSLALAAPQAAYQPSNGCAALERRLPNSVYYPSESSYQSSVLENWSRTCVEQATCVFEPANTNEVSQGVAILRQTNTSFAIRSGGHMPVPGSNGITNGVLMSLERMRVMRYANAQRSTIQLGPGLRWADVNNFTSRDALATVGGRFGPVGVPGLILGGGISYFQSLYGWAANVVSNFEVVLYNGTVVNANRTSNSDLWWALKGGSSNFGVVTRFDTMTFSLPQIWGGSATYNASSVNAIVAAFASYVLPSGGSSDSGTHVDPTIQYNTSSGVLTAQALYSHVGSDPDPASVRNFTRIPALTRNMSVRQRIAGFTNETSQPANGDRSLRQNWASTALYAGPQAVALINRTWFEFAMDPTLRSVPGGALVGTTYQLLTPAMLRAARASGGDPMDIVDPGTGLNVALYNVAWSDAGSDGVINRALQRYHDLLVQRATDAGIHYQYTFLNDAAAFQRGYVLPTYGQGRSIARLRQVARRYDPEAVFQRLVPGGFKLGQ